MNNAQDIETQDTELIDSLEAALGPDALDLLRIRADLAPGSNYLLRLLTYTLWLITEGGKEYPGQAHRRAALVAQLSQNDFFERCAPRLAPTQAAALTAAVTPYPLSSLAKLIWLIRDDLQRSFDLITPAGRERYLNWLLIEGQTQVGYTLQPEDYAALNSPAALEFWLSQRPHLDAIALRNPASPYPLSNWAKVIWLKRADLRASFDLNSPSVRQNYLIWLLSEGVIYSGYRPSQSDYDALDSDAALSFWLEKLALEPAYPPAEPPSSNPDPLRDQLIEQLRQPEFFQPWIRKLAPALAPVLTAAASPYPLSNLAKLIWVIREDLQHLFDVITPAGRENYLSWLLGEGRQRVGYGPQLEDFAALNSPAALEFWLAKTQHPDAIALRSAASPYPLSNWAKVIWLKREDLAQSFDLNSPLGRQNYLLWLLREGGLHTGYTPSQADYEALNSPAALEFWLAKTQHPDAIALRSAASPYPLSNWAKVIWLKREDLAQSFDLNSPLGRQNYLLWLLREGGLHTGYTPSQADYEALNSPAALEFWLAKTQHPDAIALRSAASPYPLSNWAKVIWLKREDLAQSFDLNSPLGRQDYLLWLLGEGGLHTGYTPRQADYDALNSPAALEFWLEQTAFSPAEALRAEPTVAPVSTWAKTLWLKRRDLQQHFDLLQASGRTAFLAWLADHGLQEGRYGTAGPPPTSEIAPATPEPLPAPVDVAIRGFGNKVMGLGEDARTLYAALQQAGMRVAAENLQIPDRSIRVACEFGRPYQPGSAAKVAIFPLPLWDLTISRLFYGPQLMQRAYNIAFAPWEFGCWPQALNFCSRYVDEVWASTTFLEQAYRRALEVPVYAMPLVVDLPAFEPRSRQFFGLPEEAFIFMYTFDFNSSLVRKNPFDLIKAFQLAFPNANDCSVALVLKVISLNVKDDLARQLLETAQRDRRIYLIDTALERADLLALMQSADCYVSLHRSEGFGRTIAEAMLLEKPVITTGYSGNVDFCTPETAYMVDYTLKPVAKDEYPHAEDLLWAQPNLETAIEYLRQAAERPADAQSKIRQAKAFIQQRYSLENVSAVYRQRLSQLL